jgi:peptide/nickel transport system substrate-binding protein
MERGFHRADHQLREGHKWSDGAPFTAHDMKFWYNNLALDPNVVESPQDYGLDHRRAR